jgi:hypothetical protein
MTEALAEAKDPSSGSEEHGKKPPRLWVRFLPLLPTYRVDLLGNPSCPYIKRRILDFGRLGSVRLHHWYSDDDDRALHDHPWNFLTVVLWGDYVDVSYDGETWVYDYLHRGSIRHRRADWAHTVRTDGALTLVFTGPKIRQFGFWARDGIRRRWFKANKYFLTWGHPPCMG